MKVSIVLATYNESGNIVKLIKEISENCNKYKIKYEIVVVDDNSPDGTAKLIKENFFKEKKVKIIVRKNEKGLGTAVGRGVKESTGDIVVFMDADFSHSPSEIPELVKLCNKYDLASGSRHIYGGELKTSFLRKMAAKSMKIFIGSLLRLRMTDYTNGFFAVRRNVLDKLDFDKIFYGYGDYYFRLYYFASKQGAMIKEIPSVYKFREIGESNTNLLKHGLQYIREVLKIKFEQIKFN